MSFIPERPVPMMVMRLFELPVQISLPLYSWKDRLTRSRWPIWYYRRTRTACINSS